VDAGQNPSTLRIMDCPDATMLQNFANDRCVAAIASYVRGHLRSCSACRQALASLRGGAPVDTPDVASIDLLLGRFSLTRVLGEGAFATVWEATDLLFQREVAVKVLRGLDAEVKRRLARESRILMGLRHPGIVRILDAHIAADSQAEDVLIMELLHGETLAERLSRRCPMSSATLLPYAIQLFEALDYAHSQGVVHRDLKPQNIFLNKNESLTIIDFGLARADHTTQSSLKGLTATGVAVGTPRYMAPEQLFFGEMDPRADMWAAGITLFQCLTGTFPTEGRDLRAFAENLAQGQIARLAHMDTELARVVDQLLQVNPGDRPSAGNLAVKLRRSGSSL
jgi:eukaryotic-like serine/threonine-protein kinase